MLQTPASMLGYHRSNHHLPVFWQAIYIVCIGFVFAYIFFDILDLDGSDFQSRHYPTKSSAVLREVQTYPDRFYHPDLAKLAGYFASLATAGKPDLIPSHEIGILRLSVLSSLRDRGYRGALPRSSIEDSVPSA